MPVILFIFKDIITFNKKMRILFLLCCILFSAALYAQDLSKLQKEMRDLLADYPYKFVHFKQTDSPINLNMNIEGTTKPMILHTDGKTYISASLPTTESEGAAKRLFDKWVSIINSLNLTSATLISTDCTTDEYTVYCKQWKFDNYIYLIDPRYIPFTIAIEMIKYESIYSAVLKIGDF